MGYARLAAGLAIAFLAAPLLTSPVAAVEPSVAPLTGPTAATGSWIVELVPGANSAAEGYGMARTTGGRLGQVYRHALTGFQFTGSAAAASALRRHPRVASVTPDHAIQLVESLPRGIERIWAYDNDTPANSAYHQGYRGNGARIAILDTGIDLDHPDLASSIDQGLGKNCVTPGAPPEDGYGHGTHVAGSAAAPINGVGVVGVAPEARLVAVKVFDDAGNSSESLVLCGFDHVMGLNTDADPTNDVDVMSMSFGEQRSWGSCAADPLHGAVCAAYAAGIIMVAGAGNSSVDAGSFVPAAFDEVISVSALADFDATRGGLAGCGLVADLGWFECDDTLAFFSNFGPSVDVVAPGVGVYSTTKGNGYATQSGTSMATPHVSGVAALMAAASPGLTPAAFRTLLLQTGECPDGTMSGADGACAGQGTWTDDPDGIPEPLVNALWASQGTGSPPPPPPPPTVPLAPTLTGASGGDGSVALTWTAPSSDGGTSLTGYEIWRGPTSGEEALLTTVGLGTTYTDPTVTNGTTYVYQVAAVNSVGSGPRSNELAATPQASPPPPPPPPTVTRLGGTASTFGSASSSAGSIAFSLPAGSDRLVALVSLNSTTVTVTTVTWKPDPANPSLDQALSFVGRQTVPSGGAVEIWQLAAPTPGTAGSALTHTLSANAKRVMGLHALQGVGSVGSPVGAAATANAIGVTVPSVAGGLVLDVVYGQNSTTAYTAGAGQTERWDTNTTSGLSNLRGTGSSESGADTVSMTWTTGTATRMALLGVSFNPNTSPPPPPPPTVPLAPTLTGASGGDGSVALTWTAPSSDGGTSLTGYEIWRGPTSGEEALLTTVGLGTTYTDPTVTNGTTYVYQVAAVNSVGSGPRSNELAATPQASPPPPPPPPTVTRLGGTASTFGSASSSAGSIAFSLPAGSDRLVALVSLNSTTVTVTTVTWKPDPANPSLDQALSFVGRQTVPSGGAVEIWQLAAPTPGTAGSALTHTLSANAKRVMGLHALQGVGSVGSPVGAAATANAIGVTVPSVAGGLVLDVVYGQNSTTAYTAGAGQTERWDTNTTSGLSNLRGTGSSESGADTVSMTWTTGTATRMALLGVSFNPS